MNITSKIIALSSAVAFALQIALALLMLRYFPPEEVGMFLSSAKLDFFGLPWRCDTSTFGSAPRRT